MYIFPKNNEFFLTTKHPSFKKMAVRIYACVQAAHALITGRELFKVCTNIFVYGVIRSFFTKHIFVSGAIGQAFIFDGGGKGVKPFHSQAPFGQLKSSLIMNLHVSRI